MFDPKFENDQDVLRQKVSIDGSDGERSKKISDDAASLAPEGSLYKLLFDADSLHGRVEDEIFANPNYVY